jgi:hypothetical protein
VCAALLKELKLSPQDIATLRATLVARLQAAFVARRPLVPRTGLR